MPIFEYICRKCNHQFEALIYGDQKAECPKCHARKLAPQLSVFAVSTRPRSTASEQNPSSTMIVMITYTIAMPRRSRRRVVPVRYVPTSFLSDDSRPR